MSTKYLLCLLCSIALLTGCRQYGMLVKRESELNCPTDIRKTVPWCAGEDAIFRCPCGPNEQFHGHKPTCWRLWDTPGTEWRDIHCGPPCSQCKTDVYEGMTTLQSTQPVEILDPTDDGPWMPQEGSGLKELPAPENPLPVDDAVLPEPEEALQQLQAPGNVQSIHDIPQLPWHELPSEEPTVSLTDYFQPQKQSTEQSVEILVNPTQSQPIEPKPIEEDEINAPNIAMPRTPTAPPMSTKAEVRESTYLQRSKFNIAAVPSSRALAISEPSEVHQRSTSCEGESGRLALEPLVIEPIKTESELKITSAESAGDLLPVHADHIAEKRNNHLEKKAQSTLQMIVPEESPAIDNAKPEVDIESNLSVTSDQGTSAIRENIPQKAEDAKAPKRPRKPSLSFRNSGMTFVR